jgi:hypothetical protein
MAQNMTYEEFCELAKTFGLNAKSPATNFSNIPVRNQSMGEKSGPVLGVSTSIAAPTFTLAKPVSTTLNTTIPTGPIQPVQIPLLEPSDFLNWSKPFERVIESPKDEFASLLDTLWDLTPDFKDNFSREQFISLAITISKVQNDGYMEKLRKRFKMNQEEAAHFLSKMLKYDTVWKARKFRTKWTSKFLACGIPKEFNLKECIESGIGSEINNDINTLRNCLVEVPDGMTLQEVYEILKEEFPHLPL